MLPVCIVSASDQLIFGFLPYHSPAKLIGLHKPLIEFLNKDLKETVTMISAPNFKSFRERTRDGNYDLVFTAPHMARLAELEAGYKRVVMSTHMGRPMFLSLTTSGINNLSDLKGKTIALPPPRAINHHVAIETMAEHGLVVGKNVTILITPSHNSALVSLINHQAIAAVMGKSPWGNYANKYHDQIRVFAKGLEFPGFIVMAHARIVQPKVRKIQAAFLRFGKTPQGRDYLKETALEGFALIDDKSMIGLDPYVKAIFRGR